MNFFLHGAVLLALILFQTVLRPWLGCCEGLYDLLLVQVVYLGLFRSLREGLPLILIAGLTMDSFSGGVFGLFTTAYIWVWLAMRALIRMLRANSPGVQFLVVFGAVMMHNLVFIGGAYLLVPVHPGASARPGPFGWQWLWALSSGGPLLILLGRGQRRWERWSRRWLTRFHATA